MHRLSLKAAVVTLVALTGVAFAGGDKPAQPPTQQKPVEEQVALKGPRLDVVFAIDTTGSMGDEIDVVKQRLSQMVAEIGAGKPKPDVRFGMVAYKDRGEAYDVQPVELSRDVNAFYGHIRSLSADGGGDEPEDVSAALTYAIDRMNWDKDREVQKLVFLIGDAGPHHYEGEASMKTLAARAKEKRIKVTAIGCSGLASDAEREFVTVAQNTGGKFDFLTYRQVVATGDGHKRTILTRGGETYAAEGELDDREWKKGADAVARSGVAAPVATIGGGSAVAEGRIGLGVRGGGGARAKAEAGPSAPAAAAPVTYGENNLDALITSEIKDSAKAAGVAY